MSDIDDVLDQFMCEGVSGDWFARCERALLELAQLRRAVEALRGGLLRFTETGCPCSDCARARAILAEIDGKEPTDGK